MVRRQVMPPDLPTRLARKWWPYQGPDQKLIQDAIAAAVREALEEAEGIASTVYLRERKEAPDTELAGQEAAQEIALGIAALRRAP